MFLFLVSGSRKVKAIPSARHDLVIFISSANRDGRSCYRKIKLVLYFYYFLFKKIRNPTQRRPQTNDEAQILEVVSNDDCQPHACVFMFLLLHFVCGLPQTRACNCNALANATVQMLGRERITLCLGLT